MNHIIINLQVDNEWLGIVFDDNLRLGIDNKYKILWAKEPDYSDLIWCRVLKIKQMKDVFIMTLTNNISIEIWLKDDDYNWPEAMQLVLPNGQSIIF